MMKQIIVRKTQKGWMSEAMIMVETDEQFMPIPVLAFAESRWAWLAFVKGVFAARREKTRVNAMYASSRKMNGWA